jgi:hypothetical protein
LGRLIHRGFALDLDLDENFFEDKLDAPLATLRMLHFRFSLLGVPERPIVAPGCTPITAISRFLQQKVSLDSRSERETTSGSTPRTSLTHSSATLETV